MKVALRFNASHSYGMGHFYRCLALAEELRKRGHEAVFVTRVYPETAEELKKCSIETVELENENSEEDMEAIGSIGADAIIVDILDTEENFMKYLKTRCKFLMSIDDNGEGARVADKVINILYDHAEGNNIISELSYAPLREIFLRGRKERKISEKVTKILVMQGAADTRGIMSYILEKMESGDYKTDIVPALSGRMLSHASLPAEGGDYEITVIAGSAFRKIPETTKNIRVVTHVENVEEFMEDADIAITAAGMSLLELLCLGTPTITVCAERFEEETAKRVEELGATINLGFGPDIQPQTIRKAVEELSRNYEIRKGMSEKGMKLIDGNGAERIIDIIENGFLFGIKTYR